MPYFPAFRPAPLLGVLFALLVAWPHPAPGEPFYINASNTCFSCHGYTPPGGGLSVLQINGGPAAGPPYAVTVSAGSSFTAVYRCSGIGSSAHPDIGGAVLPPDTVQWVVFHGPVWSDNGHQGSTPWITPNSYFFQTDYPAAESVFGVTGLTCDDGSSSAPVDKNGLAWDEVMSVGVSVAASTAPGAYTVYVAGVGYTNAPEAWYQPLTVDVVQPSPTDTPAPPGSPTVSPTITLTPTLSPSFSVSPTYSVSPTRSPSGTPAPPTSPSPTVTVTASATPTVQGAVTGRSFPDIDQVAVIPSPALGSTAWARFHLLADADDVRLELYSQALTQVEAVDLGPRPAAWNSAPFPLDGLAPQPYFLVLRVLQGPDDHPSRVVRFFRLP